MPIKTIGPQNAVTEPAKIAATRMRRYFVEVIDTPSVWAYLSPSSKAFNLLMRVKEISSPSVITKEKIYSWSPETLLNDPRLHNKNVFI